tara:strand:- start:767 stop:1213 length:447 start_codon:yes stop_codon:yes gene_type:complete
MKEKELYIMNKVNQELKYNLKEANYKYSRFDAYDDNYIAEIKFREKDYDRVLIEFDKYTFNKEYAKYNQKYFLYIIAVPKPKKRIYIYNITEIDNKTSNFYRWNWTDKMPKQTEFKNTEKDWKYVGYIDKIYNSGIIELEQGDINEKQ